MGGQFMARTLPFQRCGLHSYLGGVHTRVTSPPSSIRIKSTDVSGAGNAAANLPKPTHGLRTTEGFRLKCHPNAPVHIGLKKRAGERA
eukprot:204229-Rhodomonas_salina.2